MLHISSLRRRQRQRRHRTDDPAARTTSLACGVVPFPLSCGSNSEAPWAVQDPGELGRTTAFSGVPLQRRRYYRQSRRRCMQGTWRQDNGLKLWAPAAGSTGGISKRRPASALLRVVIWCAEHTSGLQRQAHGWLRWVPWPFHSELKLVQKCQTLPWNKKDITYLHMEHDVVSMPPNAAATEPEEYRWQGERHLADCEQRPRKVAGTPTWPQNQPPTGRQRGGDSPTAAGHGGVGNYSTL
ncbi:uncharacterized protein [Triticum aestivum]|uniref:uncharacterized protein isoform X1 n=1 Tax=Triticum aestivum TaxID=4565 RepID=UPI001D03535D|nr:uncharacterized protein LOC123127528 isoform X1 [Triticum aestivum]